MKLIKYLFSAIFLTIVINFLEYGLVWNRVDQFIYPIILSAIFLLSFRRPRLKKLFLIISLAILAFMISIYLLDEIDLANTIGSFGFAMLTITVISYLPELFKNGFLERL